VRTGPAAIGLDIAYSEPGDDHPADHQLAEAATGCRNVIVAMREGQLIRDGSRLSALPPMRFWKQAA